MIHNTINGMKIDYRFSCTVYSERKKKHIDIISTTIIVLIITYQFALCGIHL